MCRTTIRRTSALMAFVPGIILSILFVGSPSVDAFLWPRLVPYYYPLPYVTPSVSSLSLSPRPYTSSTSASSFSYSSAPIYSSSYGSGYGNGGYGSGGYGSGGYGSGYYGSSGYYSPSSYEYPSSNYYSGSSSGILYPSSDPTYLVPPSALGSASQSQPPRSGLFGSLFQKPLLRWKFSKLGLSSGRPSGCATPCVPCGTSGSSSLLSSLRSSFSLPSSSSLPCSTPSIYPTPSSPTTTTICCTTSSSSTAIPSYVQTNVVPYLSSTHAGHYGGGGGQYSSDYHKSPSYIFSPGGSRTSALGSYATSTSSSSSTSNLYPQASEDNYDYVSSSKKKK